VSRNASKRFLGLAAAGIIGTALAYTPVSHAFNFGDMMNPGKWMGGGGDRYDDDYDDDGPYGDGGPYGGGPYGGYGGPYGGPGAKWCRREVKLQTCLNLVRKPVAQPPAEAS